VLSVPQHGWPAPPQAWQVPCVEQKVFAAVQTLIGPGRSQQGWERSPHAPHAPVAEQVPGSNMPFGALHVVPEATHFV
jgi:hypothetical protein